MFLYKVTEPRENLLFEPTTFYRTEDFSSSSPNRKPGYIEDRLLYVGNFDEISIHLLPKVYRIRVRNTDESRAGVSSLGFQPDPDKTCYIFIHRQDQQQIMAFQPTIYVFESRHFTKTPSNEYISRDPVTAIGTKSYTMPEILQKWSIQLIPVESIPELSEIFLASDILFSYQT